LKVYTSNIEGHRALNYVYRCSPHMGFHFHLLSEVGEPWQAQAAEMALRLAQQANADIKQVELDYCPWYVDALIERSESCGTRF